MLVNIPYLVLLMGLHLILVQNLNVTLRKEFKDLEHKMQAERDAVLASTERKLVLLCHKRLVPKNDRNNQVWTTTRMSDSKVSLVNTDGQHATIREDFALIIEQPYISDSGLYKCGNYSQYLVDVVSSEPTETLTQEEFENRATTFNKPKDIDNYLKFVIKEGIVQKNELDLVFYNETDDLIVFNSWGDWSTCDRCNSKGRSRRIGICTVGYWRRIMDDWIYKAIQRVKDGAKKELYEGAAKIAVENGQKNIWGLTREQIYKRNLKLNQTIEEYLANNEEKVLIEALKQALSEFNITLPVLNKIQKQQSNDTEQINLDQFPRGIPCRSHHLADHYKNQGAIVSRKSLIVYTTCEDKCLNEEEIIMKSSAGTKSVEKKVLEVTEGTSAVIKCPGYNDCQYFAWTFQEAEIDPANIEKHSKGRISIDWNDNLKFDKVFSGDFGTYRCWNRSALIGIVQLQEAHSPNHKIYFPVMTLNNIDRKQAILASTGRKLILLCHNGSERKSDKHKIVWKRTLADYGKEFLVHIDRERIKLREDLSLIIEQPSISDSGLYRCESSIYLVDVIDNEPTETLTLEELENRRSTFNPPSKILNHLKFFEKEAIIDQKYLKSAFYAEIEDIVVFNYWRDWSYCDKCDTKGRARTIGICTIARLKLIINDWWKKAVLKVTETAKKELYDGSANVVVEYGQRNTWGLTSEQIYLRNLKLNQSIEEYLTNNVDKVANEALQESLSEFNITLSNTNYLYTNLPNEEPQSLLDLFPMGIPCRSHHLEERYKDIIYVKSRKSLIVYAPCEEKCSNRDKEFYIRKTQGSKQPGFNENSAHVSKLIRREVLHVIEGKSAIIQCPGNEDAQYFIWHFEKEEMDMANIEKNTKSRIAFDWNNNLKINKLISNDSGIYSCWNRTTLIGTVKLHVSHSSVWTEKVITFDVIGVSLSFGVILTFLVIIVIFFSALKNRNLKTRI